ncbi:MAG: hypothetical protein WC939_04650 [Acholeplasmataceae bacterium]
MRIIKVIADKADYKSHDNKELIAVTLIGKDTTTFLPDFIAGEL